MKNSIIVLDFGSQYNQLIARRVRDLQVYAEVIPCTASIEEIKSYQPSGIILSGGPSSVFSEDAFGVSKEIFALGVPVLGICYGMQLTAHLLDGKVSKGSKGEYGKSQFNITHQNKLFHQLPAQFNVWMSHFDEVVQVPKGFQIAGKSETEIAAFFHQEKQISSLSITERAECPHVRLR